MIDIFKNSTFDCEKLIEYGFVLKNGVYEFSQSILNDDLILYVYVDKYLNLDIKVIDSNFNEEYTLYKLDNAEGEYVGKVKSEIETILIDIKNKCCDKIIYKSSQAQIIIDYIKTNYNTELEFLWEKFDDTAIARRYDNKKWYLVIMKLNKQKLELKNDEEVEIIDVRVDKNKESIVNNKTIFTGYHMNKQSWITICLDNSVETDFILNLIGNSYMLAKGK